MQTIDFKSPWTEYAVKAQRSLAPLSCFHGSRVTTAHVHQCCRFQSYAKTVPSQIKLTMKLTIHGKAFMGSMTTDMWSRCVTSDFTSVLWWTIEIFLDVVSQQHMVYTLLKSDVTSRDHVVRCRGSQECGSRFVNFTCQFHWRWHSPRITLKSTTLLFMRSSNAWTTKPWQQS